MGIKKLRGQQVWEKLKNWPKNTFFHYFLHVLRVVNTYPALLPFQNSPNPCKILRGIQKTRSQEAAGPASLRKIENLAKKHIFSLFSSCSLGGTHLSCSFNLFKTAQIRVKFCKESKKLGLKKLWYKRVWEKGKKIEKN